MNQKTGISVAKCALNKLHAQLSAGGFEQVSRGGGVVLGVCGVMVQEMVPKQANLNLLYTFLFKVQILSINIITLKCSIVELESFYQINEEFQRNSF